MQHRYTGMMRKIRNLLKKNISLVDVVIEMRDARIPQSSTNPDLLKVIDSKPRVVALNKRDLADPKITTEWVAYLKSNGLAAVAINALRKQGMNELWEAIDTVTHDLVERRKAKGIISRPLRLMICGIPNVGKSQLINSIVGKSQTLTGNSPGVTKGKQWIKTGRGMELLDMPGILWPRIDVPAIGRKLAIVSAISEAEYDMQELCWHLLNSEVLRWAQVAEIYGVDNQDDVVSLMEAIGRKRGFLRSGNKVDLERAASLILKDCQNGRLGRLSLERPSDFFKDEQDG